MKKSSSWSNTSYSILFWRRILLGWAPGWFEVWKTDVSVFSLSAYVPSTTYFFTICFQSFIALFKLFLNISTFHLWHFKIVTNQSFNFVQLSAIKNDYPTKLKFRCIRIYVVCNCIRNFKWTYLSWLKNWPICFIPISIEWSRGCRRHTVG